MKANILIFIVSFIVFWSAALFADPPGDGWKIKWQDEFNGSSLDLTKWSPNNNYIQNGQNTCYTNKNYEVSDGTLKLFVRKESNNCGVPYTGARLESKIRDDRYVYYEAKLRYLCDTPGFWGNFWTIGYDGNRWQWPPEFDMAEMTSNHPNRIWMVYHYKDAQGEHQTDGDWVNNVNWNEWHTYAFQWDRNENVKFFVDGVHVNTANNAPIWHQFMYVILRMGAGDSDSWGGVPNASTSFPGIAEYDYVRVYERDGNNSKPAVGLTAPHDGDTFAEGANILLQASASDPDGNLEKVEFYSGSIKLGEDTTAPFDFNWQHVATGKYSLTARAVDTWGATANSDPAVIIVGDPSQQPNVLFVTPSTSLDANDQRIKNRLEAQLNCQVTTQSASQVQSSDAQTTDAVLISESITSGDVNSKFRDVAVPVMTWEPYIYDDMKMTGAEASVDFGPANENSIFVERPEHPLSAGYEGPVDVTAASTTLNWGVPGVQAEVIAVLDAEPMKAFIFAYEKGADMVGMRAPERRLGFFLHGDTPGALTEQGWSLFDASVRWLLYQENTLVNSHPEKIPREFKLENYPNPFNPSTTLFYTLEHDAAVTLEIYDISGRLYRTLVDEYQTAGSHRAQFHAEGLAAGCYLARLTANKATQTRKMLIIR